MTWFGVTEHTPVPSIRSDKVAPSKQNMFFIKSINVNFNGYKVPLQSVLISDTTSTSTDELKPLHRERVVVPCRSL